MEARSETPASRSLDAERDLVWEDLHWIDAETQALLDSLLESLPTARLLLHRHRVAAPWEATVTVRLAEAWSTVRAGQTICRIEDPRRIELIAEADPAMLPRLKIGASATAVWRAAPGDPIPGRITRMNSSVDPGRATIQVVVAPSATRAWHVPGGRCRVAVELAGS